MDCIELIGATMTSISRVRIAWTGIAGMPGVTTLYCLDALALVPQIGTWLAPFLLRMPTGLQARVEAKGESLEDTTGVQDGFWSVAPQGALQASAGGVYAAPVGCHINWQTNTITDGRRLRGRTFMVPMSQNIYSANGTMEDGNRIALQQATSEFVVATNGNLLVWRRPREAVPADGSRPAIVARAGASGIVTSGAIPDKITVLRSRRD